MRGMAVHQSCPRCKKPWDGAACGACGYAWESDGGFGDGPSDGWPQDGPGRADGQAGGDPWGSDPGPSRPTPTPQARKAPPAQQQPVNRAPVPPPDPPRGGARPEPTGGRPTVVTGRVVSIVESQKPIPRSFREFGGDQAVASLIRVGVWLAYWAVVLFVGWMVLKVAAQAVFAIIGAVFQAIFAAILPFILVLLLPIILLSAFKKSAGPGPFGTVFQIFEGFVISKLLFSLIGLVLVPLKVVQSIGRELSRGAEQAFRRSLERQPRQISIHTITLQQAPAVGGLPSPGGSGFFTASLEGVRQGSWPNPGEIVSLRGEYDAAGVFQVSRGEVTRSNPLRTFWTSRPGGPRTSLPPGDPA
jgi:hypothetical protein